VTAGSITSTTVPASTSASRPPTVNVHKHTDASIAYTNWKTAAELGFPDKNKWQKGRSLSTAFGNKCELGEACVVPGTATDLFDPNCPFITVHSECRLAVARNEDREDKWNIPTSEVPTCQPPPINCDKTEEGSGPDGSITAGETKE
jgi:hypothetical protein